ncbi:VOC family protein [Fontisubflavum oceani]|uniref:VOC family protein n=1 Tax=Fontisubflavum oceani TaxID=2978973 RepID=UPI0025B3D03F|nr:VOC family protein [Fontisubflavum oceani]WJY21509.1 VOC family protein [Fontisubflavum oceani]
MISLALLKIPVTDLHRARAFYTTLFETEPVFHSTEYGWTQFMLGKLPIALYTPGAGGGAGVPGHDLDFQLTSPDLEALKAQILPHAPDAAIHKNADGSQSLEFRDPDGNGLKIMARVDP